MRAKKEKLTEFLSRQPYLWLPLFFYQPFNCFHPCNPAVGALEMETWGQGLSRGLLPLKSVCEKQSFKKKKKDQIYVREEILLNFLSGCRERSQQRITMFFFLSQTPLIEKQTCWGVTGVSVSPGFIRSTSP